MQATLGTPPALTTPVSIALLTPPQERREMMHHANHSYDDRKFCQACDTYVTYLQSVDQSYCVQCGGVVRLFSDDDWSRF